VTDLADDGQQAPSRAPGRRAPSRVLPRAWALAAIFGALSGIALGAEAPSYKKCPLPTQTCLDQMVSKMKGRGWLGIEYDSEKSLVQRVIPGSPAEAAGFKVGDIMISVAGKNFADNTESRCVTCDAVKDIWKPGNKIPYVLKRKGKLMRVSPKLAALPSEVMAQMIGMHMIEHAQPEAAPPPPK
jgi:predicted metalloprotease with PDZ domain